MNNLDRPARLADVAKAAGVSQGTVSNVFNRPELVREEVRVHVHAVADAIGYRGPDPKGRLLRAGKVNAIGVATAEPLSYFFEDPYARELMAGMAAASDAAGAGLSLVSAKSPERLAWNIQSAIVDGFVLLCIEGGEKLVQLTRERRLPFVALSLGKPDKTISSIGVDDVAGARLAAAHLVELGHRRFGILAVSFDDGSSGPADHAKVEGGLYSSARDRVHGYFEVLAAAGIATDTVPIYETLNDAATTIAGLDYLFSQPVPPTALLVMSDRMALIAIDWLGARGLSVPGDVSIVGFDGVPEAAQSTPPLTTVAQPIAEIGSRAVEFILEGSIDVRQQVLPVSLIVRGSTAAPKGG